MTKKKIVRVGDAPGGNYESEVLAAAARLEPFTGKLVEVSVFHDEWCAMLAGTGSCNCDPDVVDGPPTPLS